MEQSTQRVSVRGVGLAASVPKPVILDAARNTRKNNFHSFWLNNPPQADALRLLEEVAGQTPGLWLGVGVIPLTHHSGDEIAAEIEKRKLPLETFFLGIGAGSGPGGVERVAKGIETIRSRVPCQIVVAALGPKMSRLAGAEADGVLFNWLTPTWAEGSIRWVREGAEQVGRPVPRLMAYVRVALGDGAIARLEEEAGRYQSMPHYSSHFARMGVSAMGTAVTGRSREEIQRGLAQWNGVVDEVVSRAITEHDNSEELAQLIEACRPDSGQYG